MAYPQNGRDDPETKVENEASRSFAERPLSSLNHRHESFNLGSFLVVHFVVSGLHEVPILLLGGLVGWEINLD